VFFLRVGLVLLFRFVGVLFVVFGEIFVGGEVGRYECLC